MEVLKVDNLKKRYITKTVIDDLNFSLDEGKIYGLLGPNGSGKTTLIKLIAGVTQPSAGNILVAERKSVQQLNNWFLICLLLTIYLNG